MKRFITGLFIFISLITNSQENEMSEEELCTKADIYFEAYDCLCTSGLPNEDINYIQNTKDVLFDVYCTTKARFYYGELINKFPNSEKFVSYLFKKGYVTGENNNEEAKRCFLKVVEINNSSYYKKLSLHFLGQISLNEGKCDEAKNFIFQINNVQAASLNEYQNEYIEDGIKRILFNCPK